jgi:hypothetical protein
MCAFFKVNPHEKKGGVLRWGGGGKGGRKV